MLKPLFVAAAVALAAPAVAATGPAVPIATFDDALLAAMKAGKSVPLPTRVARLLPVVRATHDLDAMAAAVVGPPWTATGASDRAALIEAFARHSAVAYAENFSSWDGERFIIDPKVTPRRDSQVVTVTIAGKGTATPLLFRMRDGGSGWRIVDIYAEGVSQVAVQRSEFAAIIKAGGVAALAKQLNARDEAKLER